MGGMVCYICENIMRDHDGSIVYDIYTKNELVNYIKTNLDKDNPELLDIIYYGEVVLYNKYLWRCDKCQTVFVWDRKTEDFIGRYLKIKDFNDNIDFINIGNIDEIFVINTNDNTDDLLINDLFNENPFRPYKYYVTKDLEKVYVINTEKNRTDMIYIIDKSVTRNLEML